MLKESEILILNGFSYLAQFHHQNLSYSLLQPLLTQALIQSITAHVAKSFLELLIVFDNYSCKCKAAELLLAA